MASGLIIIGTDSDRLAQAGKALLEKRGYVVQTAQRGQPLDRLLFATSPRLVMIDLRGPDVDFGMCRRARATVGHAVPIIAMMAAPTIEQVHECLDSGASDLLVRLNDSKLFLGMVELWAVRGGRKIERPTTRNNPEADDAAGAHDTELPPPGSRPGLQDGLDPWRNTAPGSATQPGPVRDRSEDSFETALEEMTALLRGGLRSLAQRHGVACNQEMEIGYINGVLDVWSGLVPALSVRSIVALQALFQSLMRLDQKDINETLMRWGVLDERRRYRSGYDEGNVAARAYLLPDGEREDGGMLTSLSLDQVRGLGEDFPDA